MQFFLEEKEDVLIALSSNKLGLTEIEAQNRLEKNGKNRLTEAKKQSKIQSFFTQMSDPMIIVLIIAAIISGSFGQFTDMVIILIVVILNAALGVFQESKAEKAITALQKMTAPQTKVRRDGNVQSIKAENLVVGDVVLLEAGDTVPADMRIIESASLKVEEAALTGESVAVEKTEQKLKSTDQEITIGDRTNMLYMGTNIVYGRCESVVTAVGMATEMGKIAHILAQTKDEKTPLQKTLASLSKVLSGIVVAICVFIFIFGVMRNGGFSNGDQVFEMLLTAVSLAVAAIPEGLVVVVTILLSIGITKMAKNNAIIRRLTAVETLGCTKIICSDKTGTLTQNKMTVVETYGDKKLLATAVSLCSDVDISEENELIGEPTEIGLVQFALNCGVHKNELLKIAPRVEEIPFDSVRKKMTTIHCKENKNYRQFTKGAPDEILKSSSHILIDGKIEVLTPNLRNEVLKVNKQMADKALRVLAASYVDYDTLPKKIDSDTIENNLIFIGLSGMIDPIRPEVKLAIEKCVSAGIKPIMITGDHKDTAIAIAKELGILSDSSEAMTGAQLAQLSDEQFERSIEKISVYARVQPEHKVRIVKMWRKKGEITAMTGDGVNDAPAIKSADIGVGMGITGTDVTKNVADMVLADDNFATIVEAVEEGRRIYENIRKAIQFLLSTNLSEVITIFIGTLFGLQIFTPIHILWINLVTDTFPAMALGMEEAESDIMNLPPRNANESIFAGGLAIGVLYQGISVAILTLASFVIGNNQSHLIGMTMAFLTLSMCEIFDAIAMRSRTKSILSMKKQNKHLNLAIIGAFILTVIVMYTPILNTMFHLQPLSLANFAVAIGLAFLIIPIIEVIKFIKRKLK